MVHQFRPAKLTAQGGQINLASVASPGEILAGTMAKPPILMANPLAHSARFRFSSNPVIDVSGNGGGTVLIRGGSFVLDNSTISANVTGSGPIIDGAEAIGAALTFK